MEEDLEEIDFQLDGVSEHQHERNEINSFALFITQFAWLIILLIPVGLGFLFPRMHPAQLLTSKQPSKKWDTKEDPKIFTHSTDIHLSYAEPLKITNTRLLLHSAKFYKADFNLITGDMVDSYGEKNWPKIGHQVKEDWELWKKLVDEDADNFSILDIPGNHDMWGIIKPLSDQNLFLDYSYTFNRENTKTFKDFVVRKIVQNGIVFILISQYRFPDVHPPYTYWPHPSTEMLDWIEKEIENAGPCYVACHYPVDHNWWIKSSKGHTFEEIMESKNIEVIFSGHFHPYDPIIIHHKQGGVEYIGVGAYQMKGFGVVTIGNNRFVYHTIRLTESPQRFLMTNPIPTEQLSSHQIFSEKETEIRIISYVDHQVKLTISGDINGEMKFDRNLTNGAKLYTFPLNVSYGVYNIHVTGDGCNITRTFYVGEKYQGHDEPYECYQRGLFLTKVSSIFVFLGILWALLPINSFKSTETEEWIEGSGSPQWLSAIFFGPNSMRTRILDLPKSVRYTLLAALLYCLVGPNHFFKSIHGYIGFSFLCFIYIAGKTLYDEWAVHMTYFYLLTIIVPATFVASSYKYKNVSFVYKFNYILLFLLWAGVQVVNYRWCGESVPIFLLFVNPTFIVIPLIIQIVFHRANINFFFSCFLSKLMY